LVFAGASARPELLSQGLHETWYVEQVWMKVYPLCGWIQGVAQLLLQLRGTQPLDAAQIDRIVVGTSAFAVRHNANPAPHDEMEAQYSIPYCAALAATADPADPAAFTLAAIADPRWHALAERVELAVDAQSEAAYPARFGSRVELRLVNGECRTGFTLDPHGTAGDSLSDAELTEKFERLARLAPQPVDAAGIARAVWQIEQEADVRNLTRLLRG
jgi:2-methylcitrate dehydratase PrpD